MGRLRIGVSARFAYGEPGAHGVMRKDRYYLEHSFARWVLQGGALALLIPDAPQGSVSLADYAAELDGLVLQGGSDISPQSYGEEALRPEWAGDPRRDRYELELLARFIDAAKPVLGVCRGQQLINVALGGTLYQDTETQKEGARRHQDTTIYEEHFHHIAIDADSRLARLYPGVTTAKVNTVHHQAVKQLGRELVVEARSTDDDVIEAIRYTGSGHVFGVQWHPEFHDSADPELLDNMPILRDFLDYAAARR